MEPQLELSVTFDCAPSPELGDGGSPRVHAWADVGSGWAEAPAEGLQVLRLPTGGAPFDYVYVEFLMDWVADSVGSASPVAVPGEGRCGAMFHRAELMRPIERDLLCREARNRKLGSVRARLVPVGPSLRSSAFIGFDSDAQYAHATRRMARARAVGDSLALRSVPIKGSAPLVKGMGSLDLRFWNEKATHMPGWSWMLSMPNAPESDAFVETMVMGAALRRGLAPEAVVELARAALSDMLRPQRSAAPSDATKRFALLVGEARFFASTFFFLKKKTKTKKTKN